MALRFIEAKRGDSEYFWLFAKSQDRSRHSVVDSAAWYTPARHGLNAASVAHLGTLSLLSIATVALLGGRLLLTGATVWLRICEVIL